MPLTVDTLLAGPRGRRLCLEILRLAPEHLEAVEATWAVSWAARALAENPGVVLAATSDGSPFTEPEVSPAEAAAALERVTIPEMSEHLLDEALTIAVDLAVYWQPPAGEDVLAATEELRPVLERVAAAVVDAPGTGWWGSPLARDAQATVRWEGERPSADTPEEITTRWRDDQAAEETRFAQQIDNTRLSGSWWSTPASRLPRSTCTRGSAGPAGLVLVEDSLGWSSAFVQPIAPPVGGVIEIDGRDAWAALCHRHPFSVTASRQNVWRWTTGREGMWVQPDWAAVAREAVGVHLSVAGYLATSGRVIDLGDLGASTVAGWGPDETFWFTPVEPSAPMQEWVRVDEGWVRA